jgi:hypothetical protein
VSEVWTGGCQCGAVRYTVRPSIRLRLYACHCTDCQTRSGSSFTLQQTVLAADLEVTGDLAEGGSANPSGARVRLYACPACQCRIYGANETRPEVVIVRAGTFDHSASLVPDVHVWVRSKQPWIRLPDDAEAHETQPDTPEAWAALLMPRAT